MSPHGPCKSFQWPSQDDVRWVPGVNIIKVLSPLSTTSEAGQSYALLENENGCDQYW